MAKRQPLHERRYKMPNPSATLTDKVIGAHITEGAKVLDLGCGDGRLLERLRDTRDASILGVELSHGELVGCIERGVPVIHGDLDAGLLEFPDDSFDFAVLSQTLQQVRRPRLILHEMLRVARQAVVVVPNFGHWKVRWHLLWAGRAPVSSSDKFQWYNTPNLHFMSMRDFQDLVEVVNGCIVKELAIIGGREIEDAWGANWRAETSLYILERNGQDVDEPGR